MVTARLYGDGLAGTTGVVGVEFYTYAEVWDPDIVVANRPRSLSTVGEDACWTPSSSESERLVRIFLLSTMSALTTASGAGFALDDIPCAFPQSSAPEACGKGGRLICTGCRLVSYCSSVRTRSATGVDHAHIILRTGMSEETLEGSLSW